MTRKRLVSLYKDGKRNYEICLILSQKLSDEALKNKINELKTIIQNLNAEVVEVAHTKLRTFCYAIGHRGNTKGYYACFYTKTDPKQIAQIRNQLKLENDVLREFIQLANPKKQSYGIFSPQYDTAEYKLKNKFYSYDDPNMLFKSLGERAKIAGKKTTSGKKIANNLSKKQRNVSKIIKAARVLALAPFQED